MFRALGPPVAAVKRNSIPVVCFGTGYFCCWTLRPDRQETVPQAFACAIVSSWGGLARSLRHFAHALPDGAAWPKTKLAQIETRELRFLARVSCSCENTGLACASLSRAILHRLCDYIDEEGPNGLAVLGLARSPEPVEGETETEANDTQKGSGLIEFVELMDASAVRTAETGSDLDLLRPMSIALSSIMTHRRAVGEQELDHPGILQMTRMALITSSWFADLQRKNQLNVDEPSSSSSGLSSEDTGDAKNELQTVWQELSQPSATPAARPAAQGRSSQPQVAELVQDVTDRLSALSRVAPPLPEESRKALIDELPANLVGRLLAAMQTKSRKVVVKRDESPKSSKSSSSITAKAGKTLEIAAWVALIIGATIALSKDGVGLIPIQIVPSRWHAHVEALIQKKAIHIEDLLQDDPIPEGRQISPAADPILLGPH